MHNFLKKKISFFDDPCPQVGDSNRSRPRHFAALLALSWEEAWLELLATHVQYPAQWPQSPQIRLNKITPRGINFGEMNGIKDDDSWYSGRPGIDEHGWRRKGRGSQGPTLLLKNFPSVSSPTAILLGVHILMGLLRNCPSDWCPTVLCSITCLIAFWGMCIWKDDSHLKKLNYASHQFSNFYGQSLTFLIWNRIWNDGTELWVFDLDWITTVNPFSHVHYTCLGVYLYL